MNSLDQYQIHYQGLSPETRRELMALRLIPISQELLEFLLDRGRVSVAKLCEHGFGVGFCGDKQCPNYTHRDSTKVP